MIELWVPESRMDSRFGNLTRLSRFRKFEYSEKCRDIDLVLVSPLGPILSCLEDTRRLGYVFMSVRA